MEAYLRAYHDRSQEYLKFSEQFRNVCAAAAHRSPPVAALAARLVAASREIDSEWERLKRDQGLDAGKWGAGMQQIYAVIDAWPADVQKKLESLRGNIIEPGTGYASFVAIAQGRSQPALPGRLRWQRERPYAETVGCGARALPPGAAKQVL